MGMDLITVAWTRDTSVETTFAAVEAVVDNIRADLLEQHVDRIDVSGESYMRDEALGEAGKRMCLYVDETMATANGYIPAVVYEDEPGYIPLAGNGAHASPWYFGKSIEVARNLVDEYNERLGLSRKDAHDIVLSSMLASR